MRKLRVVTEAAGDFGRCLLMPVHLHCFVLSCHIVNLFFFLAVTQNS